MTAQSLPSLSSAIIRGSTRYSPPELYDVYREQLGKPITRQSAQAIAERLAERYERDGYTRPRITIDDDLVAVGVLRIDVVESRIGSIEINGDPGPYGPTLEQLGEALGTDVLVRRDELQALMRQMRALRGLTVTAKTTRDGDDPEAYRLVLDTDFQPLGGVLRFSNRGTDEIGPNFLVGQAQTHGLFSGSTNLGLQFAAATDYDEYHGLGLFADVAIGAGGARARASAFRSRSNPLEAPADREDHYGRDRASLGVVVPTTDTASRTTTLSASLVYEDLAIDRSGALLRDERLRMLELGGDWVWRRAGTAQYAAGVDLIKGLGGLGSRLVAADLTDDPRRSNFAAALASFTQVLRLSDRWSTRLDTFVQYSSEVLPYSERFKIGGDRLGRGFEVAEIAGDRGIGAKIELRRTLSGAPAVLGQTSLYSFYDIGAAWKNDLPGRESAATGGFGIAIQSKRAIGHFEIAKPLTHPDVEGRRELSVFVDLTALF